MDHKKIDFETELEAGRDSYNRTLGHWWLERSGDSSHVLAYRRVALRLCELIGNVRSSDPLVVDFACGAGNLLIRLARTLPGVRLRGLDGSVLLLDRARRRLAHGVSRWEERVELIEVALPDFDLARHQADVIVFTFPNIVPGALRPIELLEQWVGRPDQAMLKYLAAVREPDPEEETITLDPETFYESLLIDRAIARNLRHLLRPGGLCLRVEYANAPRHELTQLVQNRLAFTEGTLLHPIGSYRSQPLFSLLESNYYRSRVVEDVFHQTGDETDRKGGYLISVLRAGWKPALPGL